VVVNYAVDASSVINLNNAGAFELACRLTRCKLWLSPIVVGECDPRSASIVAVLREAGIISFVNTSEVPGGLYLDLLSKHRLGEGETECIAVCAALGYALCSDDRRAREVGGYMLGAERVIGSLRILRWCVEERLVACNIAYDRFLEMVKLGGFLPPTPEAFFCDPVLGC
jgi:predicted nucleic acid-binding protein